MLACYTDVDTAAITIYIVAQHDYSSWLDEQTDFVKQWCQANDYKAKPASTCLIPDPKGHLAQVVFGKPENHWDYASVLFSLPVNQYRFDGLPDDDAEYAYLAWGLAHYQFARYKVSELETKVLVIPTDNVGFINAQCEAIYWVRDLINTPTEDMGPAQLAAATDELAKQFNAQFQQIIGEQLLQENFPAVYAVGRASDRAPRMIELQWGDDKHPHVILVGKGVCFDTGGLNLKPGQYMRLMKKDMGGAATVLGLARLIMSQALPVKLTLLIPAVENSVSGNAYRPGDVLTMRSGKTVEVGDTDAEGRLVLADALTYAAEKQPDLLLDFATLTGAARVALGTDVPVMFSNSEDLANRFLSASRDVRDPIWQLPLYQDYRSQLKSPIADLCNIGKGGYGGAIIAALFLEYFIGDVNAWCHFDVMAYNTTSRSARPEGGEAMGLRAAFAAVQGVRHLAR